jgi:hypothetical protein
MAPTQRQWPMLLLFVLESYFSFSYRAKALTSITPEQGDDLIA